MPNIGAHVGGVSLDKIPFKAKELGVKAIQIFGASPRQWVANMPPEKLIEGYKTNARACGITDLYLHGAYLVNLGSPKDDLRQKSIQSLSDHLAIAEALGARGLIFHLGSAKDMPKGDAINHTVSGMKEVLKRTPGNSWLIMENSAGGGGKLGGNLEEVGEIFRKINSERVKFCYDTAHGFEAGTTLDYTPDSIKTLVQKIDQAIGIENLVVLHANDSKTAAGSYHDKHANIGEGYVGLSGFKNLAKEKMLRDLPWLLEVPGFDDIGPDKRNVEILKGCFF